MVGQRPGSGRRAGIWIDFFKIAFVFAAALNGLRPDGSPTSAQVYRQGQGQGLVRSAIGPEAYLLGYGMPLLPSVGKVDGMRIGADTAPTWASNVPSPTPFAAGQAHDFG
jgi:alpha-galactosidase